MDSSAPPPENPYASPQVVDEPTPQDVRHVNVLELQRQVRLMWFWCLVGGGVYSAFVILAIGNQHAGTVRVWILPASMSIAVVLIVTLVGARVRSWWFGLMCGVVLILLGSTMLFIGFVLVAILIQLQFNRRYGHLLN